MAVIGLAAVSGCARQTTVSQAEPEVVPQQEAVASSGEEGATQDAEDAVPQEASVPSSGEVEKRRNEPLESLFAGRTTGLHVVKTREGALSIRVRGPSSFLLNNEPLYILDGSPFIPGPDGTLSGINPYDVQSIEVLKDPAEISRWGARGANGVIVITTTRPMK
jgi:TonB-dependent SusC/RagA subfamily outer membrane receptor